MAAAALPSGSSRRFLDDSYVQFTDCQSACELVEKPVNEILRPEMSQILKSNINNR